MFFLRNLLSPVFLAGVTRGLLNVDKQPEDQTLVAAIAAGDEGALERLYDRYKRLVYSLMVQMLGDRGQAEEATLDTFTRIWQQANTYVSNRATVKTWLTRIARNRAIDILRSRRSRLDGNTALWADGELEQLSVTQTPEQNVEELDTRRRVRTAMASLPEEQRAVLALAYLGGYSHSEIAEQLNQPLGTVKSRIRKAMQGLKVLFTEEL